MFERFKNDSFALAEKAYELPEKIEIILDNLSRLEEYNSEIKKLKKEGTEQINQKMALKQNSEPNRKAEKSEAGFCLEKKKKKKKKNNK